ncbi:hypothetical protein LCGC14_1577880 [marine sediment metagenome]|uniref:Uncharacterized protein n=1 Tax=marine sediment metagenome TaxID=412755 RepID=A0A0F9IHW8_9ZZZZ
MIQCEYKLVTTSTARSITAMGASMCESVETGLPVTELIQLVSGREYM